MGAVWFFESSSLIRSWDLNHALNWHEYFNSQIGDPWKCDGFYLILEFTGSCDSEIIIGLAAASLDPTD